MPALALLAIRDKRTTIGANLALVVVMTGLDPWTSSKQELRVGLEAAESAPVPPGDEWRLLALQKLLAARITASYKMDNAEVERLGDLISSLVIN